MTFEEVLCDIKKLVGLELSSIRPGADITLVDVDESRNCILLRNSKGVVRSRPFSELETIWEELTTNVAVHVEGVLHGSGTSRNQPETLFANLPYIEWLKINNKKHITYIGAKTHAYGTLRQMDPMTAADLIAKINTNLSTKKCIAVIVTDDISACVEALRRVNSGITEAIEQGIYKYDTAIGYYIIAASFTTALAVGTYVVIQSMNHQMLNTVNVGSEEFWEICDSGLNALVRKI